MREKQRKELPAPGTQKGGSVDWLQPALPAAHHAVIGVHDLSRQTEAALGQYTSRSVVVGLRVGPHPLYVATGQREADQCLDSLSREAAPSMRRIYCISHLNNAFSVWRPF